MDYSAGKYWWHEKNFFQAESSFTLVDICNKRNLKNNNEIYFPTIGKDFFKASQQSTGDSVKKKPSLSRTVIKFVNKFPLFGG